MSNGSGTVSEANVTNVQVICVTGGQVQFVSSVAEVIENEGPVTLTVNPVGGTDGATSFDCIPHPAMPRRVHLRR